MQTKKALILIAFLLFPNCSLAIDTRRKIDLEYRKPSPLMTLASGTFVPGGGWIYLDSSRNRKKWDVATGAFFMVVTTAIGLVAFNGIRTKNGPQAILGVTGFMLTRTFDVILSTDEAYRRRRE